LKSNYEIFNASAGSGKTFTLTSRYLVKLLGSSENESYKRILALTFTNKASEEMKNRILSSLNEFSKLKNYEKPSEILKDVKNQLDISFKEICLRAKNRLNLLLHNFSFFNVSTLDSFNHGIIKAFAKELNLAKDFKLVLDNNELTENTIKELLTRVGNEKAITDSLIDFANSKILEGKSWDVSYDLKELSSILSNENHYFKVKKLKQKTTIEFVHIKKEIIQRIKKIDKVISEGVRLSKNLITKTIPFVFSRNSYPNFLEKLKNKEFKKIKTESLRKLFENETLIIKKSRLDNEEVASQLLKKLFIYFEEIEKNLIDRHILNAFLDSLVPLSLLNQISLISKKIMDKNGELLISDFNKIISEEIKNQPSPYIFEKTGTRFSHYLIDEFQDTSLLQWANLIPLVSHSIESYENEVNGGSLLLVGDLKQSLYRWRGADPNIFFSLINNQNPFTIEQQNQTLKKNYRSSDNIINFNNDFFKHVSEKLIYKENQILYESSVKQDLNNNKGGYVSINFIENKNKKELYESYLINTLKVIDDCRERGFRYFDQAILVRNKNQQKLIADFLTLRGIPVISAEALLISSSPKVKLLVELIRLRHTPNDLKSRGIVLKQMIPDEESVDTFEFFNKLLNQSIESFFKSLFGISFKKFLKLSVSSALVNVQRKMNWEDNVHIQFLNDELFEFFSNNDKNEIQFLDYWENNQDKLNIVTSGSTDAIQILTVHKSKGLEFPVIIYPFADSESHKSYNKKVWMPFKNNGQTTDFLIPFNNLIQKELSTGLELYNKVRKEEELDNLNVLYVALTRAASELYVIANNPIKTSYTSHNGLLKSFLEKSNNNKKVLQYQFGDKTKINLTKKVSPKSEYNILNASKHVTYTPIYITQYIDQKINFGILFHKFMSKIEYSFQIENEQEALKNTTALNKKSLNEIIDLAKSILSNKTLSQYFTKKYRVMCEKEIITPSGEILIPDRILISEKKTCIIIEYKTGEKRKEHALQVGKYKNTLVNMGLNVEKSFLVYVSPFLEVIEL
jgi:ATP-dependent exoDNAse (exonuclease V) beta subunit